MSQDPNDPNNSTNLILAPSTVTQPITYIPGGFVTFTYSGNTWVTTTVAPTTEEKIVEEKKPKNEGCNCIKCKNFNEYAEPNQEDGTFICYACRRGW